MLSKYNNAYFELLNFCNVKKIKSQAQKILNKNYDYDWFVIIDTMYSVGSIHFFCVATTNIFIGYSKYIIKYMFLCKYLLFENL